MRILIITDNIDKSRKYMNSKCIMPEQPYCPVCKYGYIVHNFDDDEFCEWVCLLEDEDC